VLKATTLKTDFFLLDGDAGMERDGSGSYHEAADADRVIVAFSMYGELLGTVPALHHWY